MTTVTDVFSLAPERAVAPPTMTAAAINTEKVFATLEHDAPPVEAFSAFSGVSRGQWPIGSKSPNAPSKRPISGRPGLVREGLAGYLPGHATDRALRRIVRPGHQRPPRRGPPGGRARRQAGAGDRDPSRQDAAVFGRGAAGDAGGGLRAGRPRQGLRNLDHDLRRSGGDGGEARGRHAADPRAARRHRFRLRDADGRA